ncbi:TRAP-type C4-dicarboxylate transport system, small permease component [Franzmannia pantelleriensis]|uniref:TRAP transporter small permease protein n=1 Tax=Franzmannia pantelleriensis TaxID=48727 RepID=A0A1G9R239_9GAMM|nr:TRAP transporter small permease [Halomonas pantelleriensis]SDM16917.1 TRAP-type C4-dicarboxylate transport system, small permease component [Halomonas pantelleriensis]
MKYLRNYLDQLMQIICCGLFSMMIMAASWQVFSRYVLNTPSTVSEAFLRVSLIWLSMMAIAFVAGRRDHVSFTLFTDMVSARYKSVVLAGIELVFLLFAILIMLYGGYAMVTSTMSQNYPLLNIPRGYIYLSLPVSGGVIALYCVMNIIDLCKMPVSNFRGEVKDV